MSLKQAIKSTLNYAKFFDFDLTIDELVFWLISSKKYSHNQVVATLKAIKGQKPTILLSKKRLSRRKLTQKKLKTLKKILPLICLIPSIKLVAVTGSLSTENAKAQDDIDIMIITSSHTLWLTRPLLYLLLRAFSLRRPPGKHSGKEVSDKICDNLWLDLNALQVPKFKQSLYTAHEVLQVKPVFDRGNTYQAFLHANSWVKSHLNNAYLSLIETKTKSTKTTTSTNLYSWLNTLSFSLQRFYMRRKLTSEHITIHSAYFHPKTIAPKV